jgi:hypothetical protein
VELIPISDLHLKDLTQKVIHFYMKKFSQLSKRCAIKQHGTNINVQHMSHFHAAVTSMTCT